MQDVRKYDRSLEVDTWHDLANIYTGLSQWRDAEICLSKLQAIDPYSASKWHSTGKTLFPFTFWRAHNLLTFRSVAPFTFSMMRRNLPRIKLIHHRVGSPFLIHYG